MTKKNIFILIIVAAILILVAFAITGLSQKPVVSPTKYDDFAKCLASKKLTIYGAVWCSHCKTQKALFGDSFKYVPYVECTENAKECLAKGIEGYPTWMDEKGQKYVGEQTMEKLAEISSCTLPAN